MSPDDAAVSEYDPKRYAGREPPHRCSAASAAGIAKQIDPRWSYSSSPASLPATAVKKYVQVQTPTAEKQVPTWTVGGTLFLQCPYTGQVFAFTKHPAQLGSGGPHEPPRTGKSGQIGRTPEEEESLARRRPFGAGGGFSGTINITQQWLPLAKAMAAWVTAYQGEWASRPRADAQPLDLVGWLQSRYALVEGPTQTFFAYLSPVFAYPEMGWAFQSDGSATCGYDMSDGSHVSWRATPDGGSTYNHTGIGGVNFGRLINSIASTLAIVADVSGFVIAGMFINTAQAAANHLPLSDLGQALKQDWDITKDSAQLAFSIYDGDWQKAWRLATSDGSDLSAIQNAWAPGSAPDVNGQLTIPQGATASAAALPVSALTQLSAAQLVGSDVTAGGASQQRPGSGLAVVGVIVGAAAAAAAGVGIYALVSKQSYSQAWLDVLGQTAKAGQPLVQAAPQKLLFLPGDR